jgi:hypothetical protein
VSPKAQARPLFDAAIARHAAVAALRKLDPRHMLRNPVMFVVEIGSAFTTLLGVHALATGAGEAPAGFILAVSAWLWLTVVFANFAEALAEGRGKAQADALRKARRDVVAKRLREARRDAALEAVPSPLLRKGDLLLVEAGDTIPADGEVVEGVASVNESAVTGESAPVRGLPEQLRRSAAENKKSCRERFAVGQYAQHLEEIGPMLDLIDDDDTTEAFESRHGLRQECATSGVLQVKVVAGAVWDDLSRQSGFAALAWSDQRDNPTSPEGTSYALQQSLAVEHAVQTTMKFLHIVVEFHGKPQRMTVSRLTLGIDPTMRRRLVHAGSTRKITAQLRGAPVVARGELSRWTPSFGTPGEGGVGLRERGRSAPSRCPQLSAAHRSTGDLVAAAGQGHNQGHSGFVNRENHSVNRRFSRRVLFPSPAPEHPPCVRSRLRGRPPELRAAGSAHIDVHLREGQG